MIKLFKGLAKPINISLPVLMYACLEDSKMPIREQEAITYLINREEMLDIETLYRFIYIWFERTGDKRLANRGEELCKKLDSKSLIKLRVRFCTPMLVTILCCQWEKSYLKVSYLEVEEANEFLDNALCEYILYPIEQGETPYWLLRFYRDLAMFWGDVIDIEDIDTVAKDKDKWVDINSFITRMEADCLLIRTEEGLYKWVDKRIPLLLRGMERRRVYKYETFKRVSTLFSKSVRG